MTDKYIFECESCGQKNRVERLLPPGKIARCGKCHENLFDDVDDVDGLDIEAEQQ